MLSMLTSDNRLSMLTTWSLILTSSIWGDPEPEQHIHNEANDATQAGFKRSGGTQFIDVEEEGLEGRHVAVKPGRGTDLCE